MKVAFLAALGFLLLPNIVAAQSIGASNPVPTLTLTLTPQYPQPYGTLIITPESTLIDLTSAVVTISINGKQVSSGNAAPVSVTLPGPGTETTITASATSDGQQYSASATVFPGGLALVEEPVSSAPALYPGSPLVPDGGSVRIVAIPDFETSPGKQISPAALSYTWTQDGSTLDDVSGIGKQAIVIDAPLPYRSSNVSVVVESQDGSIISQSALAIESQEPTLRLYADDPLEGILFDNALSGSFAVGSETTILAEPYSFDLDNGAPSINWFLNGAAAQTGNTITLQPTGSGNGTASLSASAVGAGTEATAATSLSLTFGASGGTGLFGL